MPFLLPGLFLALSTFAGLLLRVFCGLGAGADRGRGAGCARRGAGWVRCGIGFARCGAGRARCCAGLGAATAGCLERLARAGALGSVARRVFEIRGVDADGRLAGLTGFLLP